MSEKENPKLVISVGSIQVEGDLTLADLLKRLKAVRDDLNSKGIETSIMVSGQSLDEYESTAAAGSE
ncbi:MAG TPA: hypothetical protein VF443_05030 [Nitrospira sp.]